MVRPPGDLESSLHGSGTTRYSSHLARTLCYGTTPTDAAAIHISYRSRPIFIHFPTESRCTYVYDSWDACVGPVADRLQTEGAPSRREGNAATPVPPVYGNEEPFPAAWAQATSSQSTGKRFGAPNVEVRALVGRHGDPVPGDGR